MPTSSAASGTAYSVSPRRPSLKGINENGGAWKAAGPNRKGMRRSSSSQEALCIDLGKENNIGDEDKHLVEKQATDSNENLLPDRPASRRKMMRRRSSTSGALLVQKDADQKANSFSGNPIQATRRGSTSFSNPPPLRRGSSSSNIPQQMQPLSPRKMSTGWNIKRRNSSTCAYIISPTTTRSGTSFQFPSKRSEVLEYTNNNFLKGGHIRSDITSIRVLEHMNETERKEKEEIDEKLLKIEAEKRHVEVLVNAVKEWLSLLKGIHRLSKGVPLMRSVTKACLVMNEIFTAKGGTYGASLLAMRRCGLATVNQVSHDMEKLRAKMEKGGQELSLVDGKFLEDIREILGRIQGTLETTLKMFY